MLTWMHGNRGITVMCGIIYGISLLSQLKSDVHILSYLVGVFPRREVLSPNYTLASLISHLHVHVATNACVMLKRFVKLTWMHGT